MKNTILSELESIIDRYFLCKKQFDGQCFSSGEKNYSSPFYIYFRDVELAYYSLSPQERFIFESEYLYKDKSNWWNRFFSRNEFNKLKNSASKKFLSKFYELHY